MNCKKRKGINSVKEAVDMNTKGLADEFLNPRNISTYHVYNAERAAARIMRAINLHEMISLVGDYDVDGVCSVSEMREALLDAGADDVYVRLPRRFSEGYGMSAKIVDEIESGLVITVDNGIAAIDAIAKAKEKGLDVIVIDHHLPVMNGGYAIYPKADIIVDPHIYDLDPSVYFKYYCGAGLVYKVVQYMRISQKTKDTISTFAAIATVADVMPLIGDNRNIFNIGIRNIALRRTTPGLQVLVERLQTDNKVSETDIGFKIGPMLNAPGRLYDDGAMKSFSVLVERNWKKAADMVTELNNINELRKKKKEDAIQRAKEMIDRDCQYGVNPIVIVDPETEEGIVGLVSGNITEEFNVSSIVFTEKNGFLKGSARACENDNLKEALDAVNDRHPEIFVGYGGHKAAAGVAIKKEYLQLFIDEMQEVMPEAQPKSNEIIYDLEISSGELKDMTDEVRKYAPFGEGNPQIIFKVNNFKLVPTGKDFYTEYAGGTVKFFGAGCEAIGFSLMEKYKREKFPTEMDFVGMLSYHYCKGNAIPQVEIIDFEPVKKKSIKSDLHGNISDIFKNCGFGVK